MKAWVTLMRDRWARNKLPYLGMIFSTLMTICSGGLVLSTSKTFSSIMLTLLFVFLIGALIPFILLEKEERKRRRAMYESAQKRDIDS